MRGRWSVTHTRTSIDPMNFVYNCTSNTLIMHQKQYKYTQWGRRRYIMWKKNLRKKNNRLNACLNYEGHKWYDPETRWQCACVCDAGSVTYSAHSIFWYQLFFQFLIREVSRQVIRYLFLILQKHVTCWVSTRSKTSVFFPYFDFALKIIIFEYFRLSCNRRLCTYENQVN